MKNYKNPFEYEQASKLTTDEMLDYYIEDFNYSRFISSRRNVFLVGERGTGKTMTLRYYSSPVQLKYSERQGTDLELSFVSIYIPCNTPLTHRREHELLDDLSASICSEHFLAVSIMDAALETLSQTNITITQEKENDLREELKYVLNLDIPGNLPLFRALRLALDKTNVAAQEALNNKADKNIFSKFMSFNSSVKPLLTCFTQIPELNNSHFSLMIDDAQLLNPYQVRALNSWIAYRDSSLFSFKVAITKVDSPSLKTASGGNILDGHDFTRIEMEQPYHNKPSAFGKLAYEIIKRRLDSIKANISPNEFFPISPQFERDLKEAEKEANKEAELKFPNGTEKQINDYVYKYTRAIYFRKRPSKANLPLPLYSGFDILVHISTGVIRNLLDPCYWMYDRVYSDLHAKDQNGKIIIKHIPHGIQSEIIQDRSKKKWEWMKNELDKTIEGCSHKDAKRVYQLLDNLSILFRDRLLSPISEPRAVVFTISGFKEEQYPELLEVLEIAQKAQIIYTYTSSAKDSGRRELYYMPNRILWPQRGLDPLGQYARVSIKAEHLWNAADNNKKIPFQKEEEKNEPGLFDD